MSVSCGASHKVANEDAITKLQEASARLGDKLARFRVGNATFYGFYCKDCGGYEGHAVAMGGFMALYIFPPKGRGLDAEALEILKKVVFLPQKGFGIDSAIRLYGPKSPMKASAKFPVLKKMVEARPESVELIDLLRDVAREAGETATAAWCEAELKRLDPEVYGTPTTSVPMTDFTCEQGNKITDGIAIYQKFKKKAVSIPTGTTGVPSVGVAGVSPANAATGVPPVAPQTTPVNAKTKTITLPGGATMEMIWCPAGTFMMGTPESEPERQSKETLHEVTLTKGFWLGKYEVTQAQWESVMGANPSKNKNAELPVENVTWEDCDAFCKKVGGGARFPTEAEWEYACRAGTKTAFYWGTSLNGDRANCEGESPYGTNEKGPFVGHLTKGGTYGSNPWGFCDMSGNVEEWCSDWYDLFTSDKAVDPKGPDTGHFRIVRGGYWRGLAEWCRSGRRGYGHQKATDDRRGFRLAMDE